MSISSIERSRRSEASKSTESTKADNSRQVEVIKHGLDSALEDAGLGNLEGLVSEEQKQIGENQKGSSKKSNGGKRQDYQKWRAELINSQPTQKDMIVDIQKTLNSKLEDLFEKKKKLQKKNLVAISEFNDVVSQIRNVNNLLGKVAHASYEALKALWLKIVHGIR